MRDEFTQSATKSRRLTTGFRSQRAQIAIAVIIVGAVVAVCVTLTKFRGRAAGRLTADRYAFDFGPLGPTTSKQPQHVFLLANHTAHTVRIIRKQSSCGCTTALYESDVLPAGRTLPVLVTAKWAGRSGVQNAEVVLTTDDAATPYVELKVKGTILNEVSVSPPRLNFGILAPGERAARIVDVGSPAGIRGARVVGARGSSANITVEQMNAHGEWGIPGDQPLPTRYRIWLAGVDDKENLGGYVVFDTNLRDPPHITLPLSGESQPAIWPASLFWRAEGHDTAALTEVIRVRVNHTPDHVRAAGLVPADAATSFVIGRQPWERRNGVLTIPVRFIPSKATSTFVCATLLLAINDRTYAVSLVGMCLSSQ